MSGALRKYSPEWFRAARAAIDALTAQRLSIDELLAVSLCDAAEETMTDGTEPELSSREEVLDHWCSCDVGPMDEVYALAHYLDNKDQS